MDIEDITMHVVELLDDKNKICAVDKEDSAHSHSNCSVESDLESYRNEIYEPYDRAAYEFDGRHGSDAVGQSEYSDVEPFPEKKSDCEQGESKLKPNNTSPSYEINCPFTMVTDLRNHFKDQYVIMNMSHDPNQSGYFGDTSCNLIVDSDHESTGCNGDSLASSDSPSHTSGIEEDAFDDLSSKESSLSGTSKIPKTICTKKSTIPQIRIQSNQSDITECPNSWMLTRTNDNLQRGESVARKEDMLNENGQESLADRNSEVSVGLHSFTFIKSTQVTDFKEALFDHSNGKAQTETRSDTRNLTGALDLDNLKVLPVAWSGQETAHRLPGHRLADFKTYAEDDPTNGHLHTFDQLESGNGRPQSNSPGKLSYEKMAFGNSSLMTKDCLSDISSDDYPDSPARFKKVQRSSLPKSAAVNGTTSNRYRSAVSRRCRSDFTAKLQLEDEQKKSCEREEPGRRSNMEFSKVVRDNRGSRNCLLGNYKDVIIVRLEFAERDRFYIKVYDKNTHRYWYDKIKTVDRLTCVKHQAKYEPETEFMAEELKTYLYYGNEDSDPHLKFDRVVHVTRKHQNVLIGLYNGIIITNDLTRKYYWGEISEYGYDTGYDDKESLVYNHPVIKRGSYENDVMYMMKSLQKYVLIHGITLRRGSGSSSSCSSCNTDERREARAKYYHNKVLDYIT